MRTEVVVGRIARTHGIRGELVVDIRTDSPEERFVIGSVFRATGRGINRELTITAVRPHSGRLLMSFQGITDRTAAEELRGLLLTMSVTDLPEIDEPDEFYDHQLIGLTALDPRGSRIGTVLDVMHGPAGELLVIDKNGTEVLVPFVQQIVPEVDLAGRVLVIDPPDGLFD